MPTVLVQHVARVGGKWVAAVLVLTEHWQDALVVEGCQSPTTSSRVLTGGHYLVLFAAVALGMITITRTKHCKFELIANDHDTQ